MEQKRLFSIFNKVGLEKNLKRKISRTCGIDVNEADVLPAVICRTCMNFIEKMWTYRKKCQESQINLRNNIAVKRMHLSPSGSKVENSKITPNSRKKLLFHTSKIENHVQISDAMPDIQSTDKNQCTEEIITLTDQSKIIEAVTNRETKVIAEVISKTPVMTKITNIIKRELETSSNNLCKRKGNTSMLLDNTYSGLAKFSNQKL